MNVLSGDASNSMISLMVGKAEFKSNWVIASAKPEACLMEVKRAGS